MWIQFASPKNLESVMPLLALFFVAISYLLHLWKSTPSGMTLKETLSNIFIFLVWRFLFFSAGIALQLGIFSWLASYIPWKIPHGTFTFIAAILVADFCYYWKHRFEHDFSLLWAEHSVHHSSHEYNLSTSLRLPWLGSYLNWPFFIPALFLGFDAQQIILGHQVVLAYQYLIHTEFVGKLGLLEKIFNTPSHHRVHHGSNPEYLDKNYGGIFIFWDKAFSSFREESFPAQYGTVHPINTKNPFMINMKPWMELWEHLKKQPSKTKKMKLLFTAPRNLPA